MLGSFGDLDYGFQVVPFVILKIGHSNERHETVLSGVAFFLSVQYHSKSPRCDIVSNCETQGGSNF